ncbi:hypothetical protein RHMOL_Rhmol02G0160600 [Rhododendron molle]|uniref:Uncharacterized protein n=1 Tax=Rhododendron molle TaxID=49168 RepID=A0ACC0PR23_RHOML|nr:hypothetical protein RHMOL_Rhmol02G0160600 [Rhododendron molle]
MIRAMSLERERDEREEEKQQKRRSSEKGRGGRRKSGVVVDGKVVKDGCFVVEKRSSDPSMISRLPWWR